MAHVYKAEMWQSMTRKWLVNDTHELGSGAGKWWVPCRILGMAPTNFIMMLKDTFNATGFYYEESTDFLGYYWESREDAAKYRNWINNMARKANAVV